MKAIVQDHYGPPAEVLQFRDIDLPEVGDDEVLVRVYAAGVNAADPALVKGMPYFLRLIYGLRRPKRVVPGSDLSGTVEAVGKNVTELRPADEVYGVGRGAFAEYASAPAAKLAPKPSNLSFEEAAAVPIAGITALQGIRDVGRVAPGQRVLIIGASGGVGTFAVQVAKTLGAEVTAVCSSRNIDQTRSLGADHVIDYTKEDFARKGIRYDVIFDNAGSHSLRELRKSLTAKGILIPNHGNLQSRWLASLPRLIAAMVMSVFVSQSVGMSVGSEKREHLLAMTELIEAGEVRPVIERTYTLSDAPAALAHVGDGHARGKVVISSSGAQVSE
jgi:NADPH:quinone reductase-like Zn-dependent oxidoreductase